jgi:hypothetical protein
MTVARRVELAHEHKALESVVTDVLNHDPVVVKATTTIKGKEFTGISAVDPESTKMIERHNPYEVAETSAVGRALGFAGYGLLESVASAEEVVRAVERNVQARQALQTPRAQVTAGKATSPNASTAKKTQSNGQAPSKQTNGNTRTEVAKTLQQAGLPLVDLDEPEMKEQAAVGEVKCKVCGAPAVERRGTTKGGKPYHGIFCSTQDRSHTKWIWD